MSGYSPQSFGSSLVEFGGWLNEPSNVYGEVFERYQDGFYGPYFAHGDEGIFENLRPDLLARIEGACLECFLNAEYEDIANPADAFLTNNPGLLNAAEARYFTLLRRSVPSLYEVQEAVPKSHLILKDMIRKGPPIKVMEFSATKSILQWEGIFAHVINYDGTYIMSGGALEFPPAIRNEVAGAINRMSKGLLRHIPKKRRKHLRGNDECLDIVLRNSGPIAAAFWLKRIESGLKRPESPQYGRGTYCPY